MYSKSKKKGIIIQHFILRSRSESQAWSHVTLSREDRRLLPARNTIKPGLSQARKEIPVYTDIHKRKLCKRF